MTLPKKDLKRLAEIEKINRPFLKITGLGYEIEWLISSLKLAWAQNEVMKEALQDISKSCDAGYYKFLEAKLKDSPMDDDDFYSCCGFPRDQADKALKRCEELKGGE